MKDKLFPKNYGSSDNLLFPLNHSESKKWVKYFIKEKLDKYGTYQDAIVDNEGFMFHANISPMMNIGLINPDYVVDEITEYYNKNKKEYTYIPE